MAEKYLPLNLNLGPLRQCRCRRAKPALPPDRDLPNNPDFKGFFLLVHTDVVGALEPVLKLRVAITDSELVNIRGQGHVFGTGLEVFVMVILVVAVEVDADRVADGGN